MATSNDAPLQTLLLPFSNGTLHWPDGPVAFLRARDGWPLREIAGNREVHCEQSFAPFAEPLQQAAGWTVSGQIDDAAGKGRYPLVLVLPPRQREEARALFERFRPETAHLQQLLAILELTVLIAPGDNILRHHSG